MTTDLRAALREALQLAADALPLEPPESRAGARGCAIVFEFVRECLDNRD